MFSHVTFTPKAACPRRRLAMAPVFFSSSDASQSPATLAIPFSSTLILFPHLLPFNPPSPFRCTDFRLLFCQRNARHSSSAQTASSAVVLPTSLSVLDNLQRGPPVSDCIPTENIVPGYVSQGSAAGFGAYDMHEVAVQLYIKVTNAWQRQKYFILWDFNRCGWKARGCRYDSLCESRMKLILNSIFL